jgi:hypothetical protein
MSRHLEFNQKDGGTTAPIHTMTIGIIGPRPMPKNATAIAIILIPGA